MYYIVKLNFGNTVLYSVRYIGEGSRFELSEGRLFFENKDELISCFRLNGIIPSSQNVEYFFDFDEILVWCDGSSSQVDCSKIYNCWSAVADILDSKKQSFEGNLLSSPTIRDVRHKLFLGSRFEMSPHTFATHKVHWSDKELKCLKKVLKNGIIAIFEDTPYARQKPKAVKKTLQLPENMFLKLTSYAEKQGLTFNEFVIKSLNDVIKE